MLRTGEIVFPMEEYVNWLSNTKQPVLQTKHASNIIQARRVVLRYIYVHIYAYMHVTTFNESEVIDLKESMKCYMARFGGKKAKRKTV